MSKEKNFLGMHFVILSFRRNGKLKKERKIRLRKEENEKILLSSAIKSVICNFRLIGFDEPFINHFFHFFDRRQ